MQRRAVVAERIIAMRRRLRETFENEAVFTVGVICLGLLPVAMTIAVLFVK
jgi:hypothetical protein